MADELQEAAAIRIASYQQRMSNLYNRHIKPSAFRAEDLVLRRVFEKRLTRRLANSNQIGPYVIAKVGPVGLYASNKLDGALVPIMWNAMHLKKYYQ